MNRLDFFKRLLGIAVIPILPELPEPVKLVKSCPDKPPVTSVFSDGCMECQPMLCDSSTGKCVPCASEKHEFSYEVAQHSPYGPISKIRRSTTSYAKIKVYKSFNHRRV